MVNYIVIDLSLKGSICNANPVGRWFYIKTVLPKKGVYYIAVFLTKENSLYIYNSLASTTSITVVL